MVEYDDHSFTIFALTFLAILCVPMCLYLLRRIWQRKQKTSTFYFILAFSITCLGIIWHQLENVPLTSTAPFNPYDILGISDNTPVSGIRKAYHRQSQLHHPDKNKNHPSSKKTFTQIAKAYETLTNAKSMRNYRLYGHPDGNQAIFVAIGLPSWLASTASTHWILLTYVISLGVLIGVSIRCIFNFSRKNQKSSISHAQAQFLLAGLSEDSSNMDLLELVATCISLESPDDVLEQASVHGPFFLRLLGEMTSLISQATTARVKSMNLRAR